MARRHRSLRTESVLLRNEPIDGRDVKICVSQDGTFFGSGPDAERVYAPTVDSLITKLRRAYREKKIRVQIPATMIGKGTSGTRDLVITGIHGASGNLLVRWNDTNQTEQIRVWMIDEKLCRPLSNHEKQTYAKLLRSRDQANEAFDKFISDRRIGGASDIKELIQAKIAEQIDTPQEPPEETDDPR